MDVPHIESRITFFCFSLHLKFPLVRTRQVLLPTHLSSLLSMLPEFYCWFLFFFSTVGSPHLFLPLLSHYNSLLFVIHLQLRLMDCKNVGFTAVCQQKDHSSRKHWQVILRAAPHIRSNVPQRLLSHSISGYSAQQIVTRSESDACHKAESQQ